VQKRFCARALREDTGKAKGVEDENMSRLPDARLDLVPTKDLEDLLMTHGTIDNCVRNCPASGETTNVAIPVLKAWLQQTTPSDDALAIMPCQYDKMLLQILSTKDKHLKAWQVIGLSLSESMAQDRLWSAIDILKNHGEPQTFTVRVCMVVTVKAPGEDPATSEESALCNRRRKYHGIKCCVQGIGKDKTGANNIVHLAPLPRQAQSADALLNWRQDISEPGRCPPGAEQMGRMRTINLPDSAVQIVPCQGTICMGYECPMCLQTFVPDLGGVCGVAPNDGGQKQQGCNKDVYWSSPRQ